MKAIQSCYDLARYFRSGAKKADLAHDLPKSASRLTIRRRQQALLPAYDLLKRADATEKTAARSRRTRPSSTTRYYTTSERKRGPGNYKLEPRQEGSRELPERHHAFVLDASSEEELPVVV